MDNRKLGALFVFVGALATVSTLFTFQAHSLAYEIPLGGFVVGGLYLWLGLLVRKRVPAARFFALGPCLIMVIGAYLMPLVLLVTWGAGSILSQLGSANVLLSMSPVASAVTLVLVAVYCIVMGVFAFRGLKYLRSTEGRLDFAPPGANPAVTPPFESRWVIVASAATSILALAFSSSLDFRIRAAHLPEFLQTAEMTKHEGRMQAYARERELQDEQMKRYSEIEKARVSVTGSAFSPDSRHVVVLLTGQPPRVLVLDLDSGELRRTAASSDWRPATIHDIIVAPDASMVVSGRTALSLTTGKSLNLDSMHAGTPISMPAPGRLLAYDETSGKLALLDVDRGTAIYSIDVPVAHRGDPYGGGNPGGWTHHSQSWTLDRSRFIWLTLDGTINDLDVATGVVTRTPCGDCKYGGMQRLSLTQDAIMFGGNSIVAETDPRTFPTPVYQLATHAVKRVEHRNSPVAVGAGGQSALSQFYQSDKLYHYDFSSDTPERLALDVPDGARVFEARGVQPLVLLTLYDRRARVFITDLESPRQGKPVRFMDPPLALNSMEKHQVSPDGRFLMHMENSRIEVVDLQAAMRGEPSNRVMDVLEGEQLEAAAPVTAVGKLVVLRWRGAEPTSAAPPKY